MRLLDCTFETPEENLAFDEALLHSVERGEAPDTLRFWESKRTFVVLGTAQRLAEEVHELHCDEDAIPILRRCTAGGCVIQGPGSLNFTVVVRTEENEWARNLRESYCHILNGIAAQLRARGCNARHEGICDLAADGFKISGNAQRRRRGAILHHGTLLHRADFGAMERYLKEPADRPDYRGDRSHRAFVRDIPLPANELRECVIDALGFAGERGEPLLEELTQMQSLAADKYASPDWIRRR